jgi:hypothetical protein
MPMIRVTIQHSNPTLRRHATFRQTDGAVRVVFVVMVFVWCDICFDVSSSKSRPGGTWGYFRMDGLYSGLFEGNCVVTNCQATLLESSILGRQDPAVKCTS